MTQKEEESFSWQTLFFVSGASGFGFDLIIWLLDGYHTPVMLWLGIVGFALGVCSLILQFVSRSAANKDES